jgi:hypothetical protein
MSSIFILLRRRQEVLHGVAIVFKGLSIFNVEMVKAQDGIDSECIGVFSESGKRF